MISVGSTMIRLLIRIKKRLGSITPLPLIFLKPKPPRSAKKVGKEAIQPLGIMLLR